jgi:hypothetical protein
MQPDRAFFGLVYLDPLAHKDMNLLGPTLAKSNVCVAPVSSLQSSLARRPACEDTNLVAVGITQDEVSSFFLIFRYDKAPLCKMNMLKLDKYINLIKKYP